MEGKLVSASDVMGSVRLNPRIYMEKEFPSCSKWVKSGRINNPKHIHESSSSEDVLGGFLAPQPTNPLGYHIHKFSFRFFGLLELRSCEMLICRHTNSMSCTFAKSSCKCWTIMLTVKIPINEQKY